MKPTNLAVRPGMFQTWGDALLFLVGVAAWAVIGWRCVEWVLK